MRNLVIVGGGTAGWLTALYAQKMNPEDKIVLIESEEIGVLGAGEGSTPHFLYILLGLGISIKDLIQECGVTIKNGIRFSGWNESKTFYYPFPSYAAVGEQSYHFPVANTMKTSLSPIIAAQRDEEEKDYDITYKMSERNLVPMFEKGHIEDLDFIRGLSITSDFAIHFNARDIAKFLRKVAEDRGVVRVEGIVKNIESDEDGYITSVSTENDKILSDFVFDCTGFARLIIGKFYNAKWKSHKEHLPANKALAFFLPMTEDIPPYTESIAMDYGWMWKIPLQERFGCGYVFDGTMLSDEDAKKEVVDLLGHDIEVQNIFSFDAGCYETPWVKNVLAVGLSSGFLEPLEATAIWQASKILHRFFGAPSNIDSRGQASIDQFNKFFVQETDMIVSFLYLHYVTNKTNTPFWRDFTKNNKMPDLVKDCLNVSKERPLYNEIDFIVSLAFSQYDYTVILVGNGMVDKEMLKNHTAAVPEGNFDKYESMLLNQDVLLEMLMNQRQLIEYVKSLSDENTE